MPFIVSFGSFLDDTSVLADLVLPDHSFLEAWTESQPESGAAVAVATTAGPAMRPLYTTRAMPDVLLDVGRRLKQPLDPPLPWQSFEEMLQAPAPAARRRTRRGRRAAAAAAARPGPSRASTATPTEYPFHFLPYASQALYDGSLAHLPWLQELPDPMTTAMWSSWVELNVRTAERLGVADGDLVEVASAHGTVRAPVGHLARHRARRGGDAGRAGARDASRATPAGAAPIRFACSRRWTSPRPARWPGRPPASR